MDNSYKQVKNFKTDRGHFTFEELPSLKQTKEITIGATKLGLLSYHRRYNVYEGFIYYLFY